MYLCIDNSKTEQNVFFVSMDGKKWQSHEYAASGEGSLQRDLELLLRSENITLRDIEGIAVRVGVGKFTATRLAVTFANTLAFALGIPVVAVREIDLETLEREIKNTPPAQYVHASYSAEPRIGKKD